jgi:hypothetical protein
MKNYKMDLDKVKNALLWIQSILERADVPYQIVGGLAAYIYGAQRPIADIDLYIPKEDVAKLEQELAPYISKPLTHYLEGEWDLEYLQLIYQDQKIEIGLVPGVKIRNKDGDWVNQNIDFTTSVISEFEGVRVPLMPKTQLIQYKTLLARDVDLFDIQAIG